MRIGTIGAGNIGGTLARLWTTAGHDVLISSRHPEQLADLAAQMGARCCYGTVEEAVAFGEVILLSPPLGAIVELAPRIADAAAGKVVLDTMNPFPDRDGQPANEIFERGIASALATQERLPRSRIVRAFSSVHYSDLQSRVCQQPYLLAIPFAADDIEAKNVAAQLIRDAGFEPFDLGGLAQSKPQDPGGELFGKAYTVEQARQALEHQPVSG